MSVLAQNNPLSALPGHVPAEPPSARNSELAQTSPLTPVERPLEEELILEVRLGQNILLSDAILGFVTEGGVLLPLGEMTRLLDFPIVVDPGDGRAEGWFLSEDRRFELDLLAREVLVEGGRQSLPAGEAEVQVDDIYVDSRLLSDWFPILISVDMARLAVRIESEEPLPIEQRLAREGDYARLGRDGAGRPQYPRLDHPYGPIDVPFIDTSASFGMVNDPERPYSAQYNTTIAGELAWMDAQVFLSGNDEDALSDLRVKLGRADPDAGLLGPAEATEFGIGDVFTPQLPLVAGQQEGRGGFVTNVPLVRPTEFDRTTLRGDLPLGWEVELYRNEVLIDVQRAPQDGRYEFVDVPLLFGLNVFRLVFYGPQGQRDEEIQRFNVGAGQLRPGEGHYRIAVNQHDQRTIDIDDEEEEEAAAENPESLFAPEAVVFPEDDGNRTFTDDDIRGHPRIFAEYEHGLTAGLSLAGSVAHLPLLDGREHTYVGLGARGDLFGAFARLDGAVDTLGGGALEAQILTDIYEVSVSAEHAHYFDFVSEQTGSFDDPLEMESSLRLDGTIPSWFLPAVPWSLSAGFERTRSGRFSFNGGNRVSMSAGGVRGSHSLGVRVNGDTESKPETSVDGSLLLNWRADADTTLRGGFAYAAHPIAEAQSVSLALDHGWDEDTALRFGVDRQLTGEETTLFSGSVARVFETFAVGFDASVSDFGDYALGLTVSFSLGRDPASGYPVMRPRGLASSGAAAARVYLDNNQNRTFDEGDEPLEGVGFGGRFDAVTDAEGEVFLSGLSPYRPVGIALDTGTLEDPYWQPYQEGYEVVPRPGKALQLDFPVTITGEIDGTVFLRDDGGLREVSNVEIELVDGDGAVVRSAKTAFDGFYLLEFVPPGRYEVRVAPDQAERLRLIVPAPIDVEIGPEGDVVAGVDITVERSGS